jgi:UDP:flavonoid glycosyltransferase YjiC (YdhE family)
VLGKEDARVVLSTGYQPLPEEFVKLPSNFHFEKFIPGFAMAKRADLFIHHGGHGSTLTGLSAGTPAIIIPTFSERESNARRVAQLGAGLFVLPFEGNDGEKDVSIDEFRDKVKLVLSDKSYKKNAQSVAQKMSRYSGPELAAQLILDFMKKNSV